MLGSFLGVCHGQRAATEPPSHRATEPHFAAESEKRLKDRRRKTRKVGLFRVNGDAGLLQDDTRHVQLLDA